MSEKRDPPKAEFFGKLDPARVMKLLLDLEASEAGLVPVNGTFRIYRQDECRECG